MGKDVLNILYITKHCDLACHYCYEGNDKNSEKMSLDECYENIDFIMDGRSKNETASILFFGGEPLLNWDVLIKGIDYIYNKYYLQGYNINAMIVTNGTLLNKQRIKELFKYNKMLFIHLSFDGRKETHDKNRVFKNSNIGSHDIIIKNIKPLIQYFPLVTVRSVVENPKTFMEDIRYLVSLGFKSFCLQALRGIDITQEYVDDFDKLVEDMKMYFNELGNVQINEISYPYKTSVDNLIDDAKKSDDEYHYFLPNKEKCFQKKMVEGEFQHFSKGEKADYNLLNKNNRE